MPRQAELGDSALLAVHDLLPAAAAAAEVITLKQEIIDAAPAMRARDAKECMDLFMAAGEEDTIQKLLSAAPPAVVTGADQVGDKRARDSDDEEDHKRVRRNDDRVVVSVEMSRGQIIDMYNDAVEGAMLFVVLSEARAWHKDEYIILNSTLEAAKIDEGKVNRQCDMIFSEREPGYLEAVFAMADGHASWRGQHGEAVAVLKSAPLEARAIDAVRVVYMYD